MPTQSLAGSRIRERRLDRGLRQATVAETVGISPSYLNLIEHNRRRIGGKLLADIARALGVDTSLLIEGADREMLDQMRSAAAVMGGIAEVERTEELAARYPGWSKLIALQARRIEMLDEKLRLLTDRVAYDPQLAGSLHEVISAVSAIRSSASILVGPEELDQDWQRRFHENIHKDSVRLATSSESLIAYLEAPQTLVDQANTPFEEVESYLAQRRFHLKHLEDAEPDIARAVAGSDLTGAAAIMLERVMQRYAQDAALLPLAAFERACRQTGYDPAELVRLFAVPLATVLRRLGHLPPTEDHPPIGLAVCDAAGALTYLKAVPGFSMPRSGGACPLWPLFSALSRPMQPIRLDAALPAPNETRVLCYAVAEPAAAAEFDYVPPVESTMIVITDPPEPSKAPRPVGISCRICPRTTCQSRREPALMGVIRKTGL